MERMEGSTCGTNLVLYCPHWALFNLILFFSVLQVIKNAQVAHMLREFNAFDRDIKSGGIFVSRILPPPLKHLHCLRLSPGSRRRTEELEAEFTVDVQYAICTNKLRRRNKKRVKKKVN